MKQVEKVSIAEISFTLDSDAYVSLKQYLDSLHDCYGKDPDGHEIIADIEGRIAELILDEQIYTKIVSKSLIDAIVAQLGTPDQIDDEAGEKSGEAKFTGAAGSAGLSFDTSMPRRLHRSSEGRVLGGVCSGLATYLNVNAIWIRLVFLLPVIFAIIRPFIHIVFHGDMHWYLRFGHVSRGWFWIFGLIYVVLWIALPMARTPRQKLEARGEKITPASIRQNMQGAASTPAGKKAASVAAELVTVFGRALLFLVKFVMAVIGFSMSFAAVIILIGMIAVRVDPASTAVFNGMSVISVLEGMSILSPLLFVELTLLCVMLPLLVVGVATLSFTFTWKPGRMFYGVTLGVWALSVIFWGVVSLSNARFFHDELPGRVDKWVTRNMEFRWENGEWEDDKSLRMTAEYMRNVFENGKVENLVAWERDTLVVVSKNGQDTVKIPQNKASIRFDVGDGGRKRVTVRQVE